jgi:hypothetical protein
VSQLNIGFFIASTVRDWAKKKKLRPEATLGVLCAILAKRGDDTEQMFSLGFNELEDALKEYRKRARRKDPPKRAQKESPDAAR